MKFIKELIPIHARKLVLVLLLSLLNPINITFTESSQAAYPTGSAYFNASGQYLSVPNNSDFAVGTGDFTVEWWQNMSNTPDLGTYSQTPTVWQIGGATPFGVSIEYNGYLSQDAPKVVLYLNGAKNFGTLDNFTNTYQNKWIHFAVTRSGTSVKMFVDGTQQGSTRTINYDVTDSTTALTIGNRFSESSTAVFPGYISNFHFVKGTALYTTDFLRQLVPTNSNANSKLLLLHKGSANFLTDSSGLGKVVTNVGSVQYSIGAPSWWNDTVFPTLSSTSMATNGRAINLTLSEKISTTTSPPSNFTVTLNGSETMTINSVTTSESVATLNLASLVPSGQTVTVSYTDPTAGDDTNSLQDEYGNDVATFTNQSVRNIAQSSTDYAYSSDGSSNKHLYANSSTENKIPETFTVEAWIYPQNLNCKGGSYANWTNDDGYCHVVSKGNQLSLFVASNTVDGGSGGSPGLLGFIWSGSTKYSKVKVPLDEWHHVAFSREGSGSNQTKLFLDGNLIYEGTTSIDSLINVDRDFTVGASRSDGTLTSETWGKFIGQIDEVKISKLPRNQASIQDDMHEHNADSADFLLYYDFNQESGSKLVNRAVNATSESDLTSVGSPNPIFDSTKIFVTDTTTQSAYTIVKFNRDYLVDAGGWKAPENVNSIRYLALGGGGGGGGGWNGGGGGAGGYRETNTSISPGAVYKIQIGSGGRGALYGYLPTQGESSFFRNISSLIDSVTASGGGAGATEQSPFGASDIAATSGGSGGGGVHSGGTTGAAGNKGGFTPVEGFAGGNGSSSGGVSNGEGYFAGGGGGGAGGTGGSATASGNGVPGNGGVGVTTNIIGTSLSIAGGGAGAARFMTSNVASLKTGTASHGGGAGACTTPCSIVDTGTSGTANTGGGGGGGATLNVSLTGLGGFGGSGLIVIKYITNKPVINKQPASDTITVGAVETFTVNTTAPVSPVTKSVKWQYSADTTTVVEANISGWTDVSSGTGYTTDIFTTAAVTKAMNKYRYRAIVTFADTSTITSVETSTIATLTINDSINFTSDTSTITRKYGDTQTVRTLTYSGGTSPHTVTTPYGALANGKIYIDTSTSTTYFKVDTGTVVGTYYETVTVTDNSGVSASYAQKVIVNPADTLTVQADTLTAITYNPTGMSINPTVTITGLVASDTRSAITLTFSESTCAIGGTCSLGDTGPGGGTIFYISGSTYYEAAPKSWYSTVNYNGSTYTNSDVKFCSDNSYNTKNQNFSFTASTGWGGGKTNTAAFVNSANSGCTTGAVQLSNQYRGGGKDDWYIPNATELNALASYWVNRSAITSQFAETISAFYWTSDASWDAQYGWLLTQPYFNSTSVWTQAGAAYNHQGGYIIPIRYFTASGGTQNLVGNPTNAGTYTITPSALTLANGVDTNNYVNVVYRSSQFIINKATQSSLTIASKLGDFKGNPSTMKLGTSGGTDTGTITFAIASGGTAGGCAISGDSLNVTSAGTCKVVATKAATRNYLIAYSDTATITFSLFVSHQPVQTQSVPTQLPINGANALDTATVSVSTLVINSVSRTGAGAHTISGTGFSNIEVVRIGGTDLTGSNYSVAGTGDSISLSGVSALTGPLFIRKTDGQEAVYFQINWS